MTDFLPKTKQEALAMANERREWSEYAESHDLHGSAREWRVTEALLRYYAAHLDPPPPAVLPLDPNNWVTKLGAHPDQPSVEVSVHGQGSMGVKA